MSERTSPALKKAIELAEAKREAIANALLAWPAVEQAIRLAAADGARRVVLAPAKPIEINKTSAAKEGKAAIERLGFRTRWVEHRPIITAPAGDALEVEW